MRANGPSVFRYGPDRNYSRRMTGRPRSAHIDDAVLEAVVEVLLEVGYGRLTVEAVARRAGTTKPAIYRRWPDRRDLALAALTRYLGADGEPPAPDSGCVVCDLVDGLGVFLAASRRVPPGVLGSLLADCPDGSAPRVAFMNALFDPPRHLVGTVVKEAQERGDLRADLDRDLVVDLLGSLVHYRALYGHAPTDCEAVEASVVTLLRGLAADGPALTTRKADHHHNGLTT
jgi:AcrR family transcriptional regulator